MKYNWQAKQFQFYLRILAFFFFFFYNHTVMEIFYFISYFLTTIQKGSKLKSFRGSEAFLRLTSWLRKKKSEYTAHAEHVM